MVAGTIVMVIGVSIAKSANMFHYEMIHYSLDMVGYGIHGLGVVPFIEWLLNE